VLYALPDAQAIAPVDVIDIRERHELREHHVGALAVSKDQKNIDALHASVRHDDDLAFVNLANGDLTWKAPDPCYWFERWSIVVPGIECHELVCSFGTAPPAQRGSVLSHMGDRPDL
jgi:hypothetical protein